MNEKQAFDRQLEREIDVLAGPEPRVDVREIVEGATTTQRRHWFGRRFGSLQAVATAAVLVLVIGIGVSFVLTTERAAVVAPAASPSPSPSAGPGANEATPVTGTWTMPDPSACAEARPMASEEWISSLEICDGLRFDVTDGPRLTGEGHVRYEEWDEGTGPEIWRVFNDGGWWESQRYHEHDRFVFLGKAGYDGLTAVLTLADDDTLSGFLRVGERRGDDE